MARARRYGVNWHMEAEIRDLAARGQSQSAIRQRLIERYPGLYRNQLDAAIGRANQSLNVEDILLADRSTYVRSLRQTVGCDESSPRVRVGMVLSYTDPRTGQRRQFGADVDLRGQGRIGDILDRAIEAVRTIASSMGYQIPNLRDLQTSDLNFHMDINNVRCV